MSFSPLGLTPLIGVFDMPRALAFYRDVLGFAVVSASPEVETAEGRVLASSAVDLRDLPSEIRCEWPSRLAPALAYPGSSSSDTQ